jgi:hypothetical protein
MGVVSFATKAKDWLPAERSAGHYLYALSKAELPGAGIILEPLPDSVPNARKIHRRVVEWFADCEIPVLTMEDLRDERLLDRVLDGSK